MIYDEAGLFEYSRVSGSSPPDEDPMIDKQVRSLDEAVADVFDGAVVMVGGFGEAGSPIELIHALIDQGATPTSRS